MSPQHIENSDRGITLNKSLAWTIGWGLVTASLYVGWQIAALSTGLDQVARVSDEATQSRGQIEVRVRALENRAAESRVQFDTLYQSLQEIRADQRENNKLLRQLLNGQ